jgi:hypothetical protein
MAKTKNTGTRDPELKAGEEVSGPALKFKVD